MLGFLGILGDRQAAALLDALDADRTVAVGTRQDDRRRVRAVGVGESAEEQVDGDAAAALGRELFADQVPVRRCQRLAGGNDVAMIGLDPGRPVDLLLS